MRFILKMIALLLITSVSFADSWYFKKELVKKSFVFDKTKVVRIIDTRENSQYPKYRLMIYYEGIEEANFKNLTFDSMVPFDKGKYLLGVSNSGLSSLAYFILTSTGNLVTAVNHSSKIHYCEQSSTLRRDWVTKEILSPVETYNTIENEFDKNDPYIFLESVKIKGCDGDDVEIWAK